MSWKGFTCSSNIKDHEDRRRKYCVCGGHNLNNIKRNLNHNSTKKRLEIRKQRKLKYEMINNYVED